MQIRLSCSGLACQLLSNSSTVALNETVIKLSSVIVCDLGVLFDAVLIHATAPTHFPYNAAVLSSPAQFALSSSSTWLRHCCQTGCCFRPCLPGLLHCCPCRFASHRCCCVTVQTVLDLKPHARVTLLCRYSSGLRETFSTNCATRHSSAMLQITITYSNASLTYLNGHVCDCPGTL